MDNREKKYLFDIQNSIANIDSYIGEPKLFDTFEKKPDAPGCS